MRAPGSRPGFLFRLVIPATSVFIVTILSLIAVLFSDERAPVAQWLNRHGNTLLMVELLIVVVLSLLAMTVDRVQTLRAQDRPSDAAAAHSTPQREGDRGSGDSAIPSEVAVDPARPSRRD